MKSDFKALMKSSYETHLRFYEQWKLARMDEKSRSEPIEVSRARNECIQANDRLFNELGKYEQTFWEGDAYAVDAILEFCEIDIPCFRCGYAKQKFFRRMKSLTLNEKQKKRLQNLALQFCTTETYRVEFRDLARLMIVIADEDFNRRLRDIVEIESGKKQFKAKLMLSTILNSRSGLESEARKITVIKS